jgi:aminocarboxymuconate-semialdehyde decarboxylase
VSARAFPLGPLFHRCRCRGIDVHTHVVPSSFPGRDPLPTHWPSTLAAEPCHATVVIDGRPYRTVSDACWVAERRIEAMDAAGIAVQALSPMPELFGYWMEAEAAADLARYTNDVIAAMVEAGNGRFVGLGGVPLQDLDRALAELDRLTGELGFAGIEIGSNINGMPIGHPDLKSFFAEVERRGVAVFVHAVRPVGMDRLVGPVPLQQVLAYPSDVGLSAASAITGNLLTDFPNLRIGLSHGGGTLATLLPRLEQGVKVFPALKETLTVSPSEQARRFFVDSLVFDAATLARAIDIFGTDRVMIGTDYPFNFQDREPLASLAAAVAETDLREQLIWRNAAVFLNLPAS